MRIVVVSNLYPSPAHPAFGTFIRARVDALRALGADVVVVANRDPAVHRRLAAKYGRLAIEAGRTTAGLRLGRRRVDVVEAHIAYPTGLVARPAARVLGARLVLFAHGADVLEVPDRSKRHRRLARSTYGAADLVIANSAFLASELVRRFPSVEPRLRVVSPGIEFDRFAAEPLPGVASRGGVVFVGRLVPDKGGDVLIRALATLPHDERPRLTLIGDGPERDRLLDLARDSDVAIDARGPLDRAAVAEAMRHASVVAVPSIYQEPLGLVAIEGMAAGAIVVASAVGGLTETVRDGVNGLTVPPGDPAALAAAIRRAMRLQGDRVAGPAMRAAARETAASHDVASVARASLALYGTLRR